MPGMDDIVYGVHFTTFFFVFHVFLCFKISIFPIKALFINLIVPQQRKFVFETTGDIIEISAKQKPDFSLIKAANAFRAIEIHAKSLLNQPLKQKLWTIRQDSGFHKKRIVDVLSGSDKMFFGMGYRASPNMPQMLFFTQHGDVQTPVNINKAQVVVFDWQKHYQHK